MRLVADCAWLCLVLLGFWQRMDEDEGERSVFVTAYIQDYMYSLPNHYPRRGDQPSAKADCATACISRNTAIPKKHPEEYHFAQNEPISLNTLHHRLQGLLSHPQTLNPKHRQRAHRRAILV